MNCIISMGVPNALCAAGDTQSCPTGTPRASAISGVTLGPGSTPPWPGLAPWLSLSSIIFTCGSQRVGGKLVGVERAVVVAAAKVARADLPDQVAAVQAVVLEMEPSPVSCANPPSLAPAFSARMALALSAPKLMADMLNTLAE
jgi:hypothetical protein